MLSLKPALPCTLIVIHTVQMCKLQNDVGLLRCIVQDWRRKCVSCAQWERSQRTCAGPLTGKQTESAGFAISLPETIRPKSHRQNRHRLPPNPSRPSPNPDQTQPEIDSEKTICIQTSFSFNRVRRRARRWSDPSRGSPLGLFLSWPPKSASPSRPCAPARRPRMPGSGLLLPAGLDPFGRTAVGCGP